MGQQGDGRREGGSRTRRRLIETAQELLAERGEDATSPLSSCSGGSIRRRE
jgi:AcrR family transcriptional regulator